MQQNQDNLINETPYSPPKSTDFRQPENNYQPTKGQRIARIILGVFLISFSISFFQLIFILIKNYSFQEVLREFKEYPSVIAVLFFGFSLLYIIPSIIFSSFTEYYFLKIKSKICYIIVSSFLIYIGVTSILIFNFILFNNQSFNMQSYFNSVIVSLKDKKILFAYFYSILVIGIALWIYLFVFEKHRKYYAKKSIQAA